ncbi:hypothetical protein AHiyo8_54220 [Arthrobacter sp. Hiyo8]|nr:hypothetical protein AHiyo8_54220 [Arthrobacter sp. Hiyo8]
MLSAPWRTVPATVGIKKGSSARIAGAKARRIMNSVSSRALASGWRGERTRHRLPSESSRSAESKSAASSGAEAAAIGVRPGTAAVATAASSNGVLLTSSTVD